MDAAKPAALGFSQDNENEVEPTDKMTYQLSENDKEYTLTIELYENKEIQFIVRENNETFQTQYKKSLKYPELLKILLFPKDYYTSLDKIYTIINKYAEKKKINIVHKPENLILIIKKILDIDEIECPIELEKKSISSKEMINNLITEIEHIKEKCLLYIKEQQKLNEKQLQICNQINEINKKNYITSEEYNQIKEASDQLRKENKDIKDSINKIINDNKKIKDIINEIKELYRNNQDKLTKLLNDKEKGNKQYLIIKEENNKLKENLDIIIKEIETVKEKNKEYKILLKEMEKMKEGNQILKLKIKEIEKIKEENKVLRLRIDMYEKIMEKEKRKKEERKKKEKRRKEKKKREKKEKEERMEYKENPEKIKMKEYLTKNHSNSDVLSQFEVYQGIKDKEVYLVYNNKDNYNIEVMRIKDKVIINSL